LAIFDLDGTLSRRDTFGPFVAGLLRRHPLRVLRVPLLLLPALAFLLRVLDRGQLKGAVLHLLFKGLPRDAVQSSAQQYAAHVVPARLFREALAAWRAHQAAGDYVVLLSASPDLYVTAIGQQLGAVETICTTIRWQGNALDGRLSGANRRDQEKLRVLETLRQQHPGWRVIGYGNSSADLPHLFACDEAVYVNPGRHGAAPLLARGLRCVRWQ
jgi:HAD superfamily hydrolase (TIGR01490 family)